jgi:hypothetical protein
MIIVDMITCSIFGYIYLNDLKLRIKKFHLFLQLIVISIDSIFYDDAMCQQGVIINSQYHDSWH